MRLRRGPVHGLRQIERHPLEPRAHHPLDLGPRLTELLLEVLALLERFARVLGALLLVLEQLLGLDRAVRVCRHAYVRQQGLADLAARDALEVARVDLDRAPSAHGLVELRGDSWDLRLDLLERDLLLLEHLVEALAVDEHVGRVLGGLLEELLGPLRVALGQLAGLQEAGGLLHALERLLRLARAHRVAQELRAGAGPAEQCGAVQRLHDDAMQAFEDLVGRDGRQRLLQVALGRLERLVEADDVAGAGVERQRLAARHDLADDVRELLDGLRADLAAGRLQRVPPESPQAARERRIDHGFGDLFRQASAKRVPHRLGGDRAADGAASGFHEAVEDADPERGLARRLAVVAGCTHVDVRVAGLDLRRVRRDPRDRPDPETLHSARCCGHGRERAASRPQRGACCRADRRGRHDGRQSFAQLPERARRAGREAARLRRQRPQAPLHAGQLSHDLILRRQLLQPGRIDRAVDECRVLLVLDLPPQVAQRSALAGQFAGAVVAPHLLEPTLDALQVVEVVVRDLGEAAVLQLLRKNGAMRGEVAELQLLHRDQLADLIRLEVGQRISWQPSPACQALDVRGVGRVARQALPVALQHELVALLAIREHPPPNALSGHVGVGLLGLSELRNLTSHRRLRRAERNASRVAG